MPRENRNKLNVSTLESILRIKSHLMLKSQCCKDFTVTLNMLKLSYSDMYQSSSQNLPTPSTNSNNAEIQLDNEVKKKQFADISAISF